MKKLLLQQRHFFLYCAIGVAGATLDFCMYRLLLHSGRLHYEAANAAGYASGTLLSFLLNARFNFVVTDKIALRLARFFGVSLLGWLVSAGVLLILIGGGGCNAYLAKLASLVVVVLLQYNLNRRFSFPKAV